MANFAAAASLTHLDKLTNVYRVTSSAGDWKIGEVIPVQALFGGTEYHLLHITNAQGVIVAAAALTAEGYLMAYEESEGFDPPRPLTLDAARRFVDGKLGQRQPRRLQYIYQPSIVEPGASHFVPLVSVEREDGTYLVNSGAVVFRHPRPGEATRDGPWLMNRDGSRQPVVEVR